MVDNDVRLSIVYRQRGPAIRRVRDVLRSTILAGEYAGGPLPSEQVLMLQYSVSRGVIRDVLSLLRDEGLIQRLQGAGTFVVTPALSARNIDVLDAEREATDSSRMFRELVSVQRVPAPPAVGERLSIPVGSDAVYHERVNYLDGQPVTLRTGWMSAEVGSPMLSLGRELQAPVLYVIQSVLGHTVVSAELKVEACVSDSTTAPLLGIDLGAPLVLIERLVRGSEGRALELSYSRIRGDRLFLSTILERATPL
jgi:GntR family transcriptional regulator